MAKCFIILSSIFSQFLWNNTDAEVFKSVVDTFSLDECIEMALVNSKAIEVLNYNQQLNEINYASSIHSLKPSISFSVSPVYNQSISGVTQPDGSLKNVSVQNISGSMSINTSIPFELTGGSLSLSQSANYYRYINGTSSYNSFGISLYQISYSQPLSFFRRNKYIRQNAYANYKIRQIKSHQEILDIKRGAIDIYFDILKAQENIRLLEDMLKRYDVILEQYKLLFNAGKCLSIDLDLLQLEKEELSLSIKEYRTRRIIKMEEFNNNYGDPLLYSKVVLSIPAMKKPSFHSGILISRLDSLQKEYASLTMQATSQQLAEARSNMFDLPTVSISIGNNTSFEYFSQFKSNLKPSYNVSLSFNTTFTDYNEKRRKLKQAELSRNIYLADIESRNEREFISLEEMLNKLDICYDRYLLLNQTLSTQSNYLDIKEELLKAQKITLRDFNSQIKTIISIKNDIINNILTHILCEAQLKCLMQYEN